LVKEGWPACPPLSHAYCAGLADVSSVICGCGWQCFIDTAIDR
jgi:hypothetical protein